MTVSSVSASIEYYGRVVHIIKLRTDSLCKTIELVYARKHYLEVSIVAEFCWLQLRYCCELLALGCIAVHRDVPTKSLHKEWNAYRVMTAFEQIKPNFFPKPVRTERDPQGNLVQRDVSDALTKKELLREYKFFGEMLHTVTFDKLSNPETKEYDFALIKEFTRKFMNLLSEHTYLLHDGKTMLHVVMHDVRSGGAPSWRVYTRNSKQPSTPSPKR